MQDKKRSMGSGYPRFWAAAISMTLCLQTTVGAQTPQAQAPGTPTGATDQSVTPSAAVLTDYVIGTDDVLNILFWRDDAMTSEVTVRPDGKISLPLLNDVQAAGLTPEQLRLQIIELARKFITEPNVSVIVKQLNSQKAFVTGQVTRPGAYLVTLPTTVLQILALAGGVGEFAKIKDIAIIRPGLAAPLRFNYDEVRRGQKLEQNITLKAGDTVIVP